ncbi:hypothetical protein LRP67_15325 [Nocardioides sp. cx-169]|nr:hypothetical protein [Nocardioides sp. cx-169]MCD4535463.1 hypothetical protein [Nocardioides sp. cx-169]
MTTNPTEPLPDPDVVPSPGPTDPAVPPAPGPGETPPDPTLPETEPVLP